MAIKIICWPPISVVQEYHQSVLFSQIEGTRPSHKTIRTRSVSQQQCEPYLCPVGFKTGSKTTKSIENSFAFASGFFNDTKFRLQNEDLITLDSFGRFMYSLNFSEFLCAKKNINRDLIQKVGVSAAKILAKTFVQKKCVSPKARGFASELRIKA